MPLVYSWELTNRAARTTLSSGDAVEEPVSPAATSAQQFTLTSPSTSSAPFCVGYGFRKGAIPSGQGIVVSDATAQATVKNRWTDGSVKFAIVAGTMSLVSNVPSTITLSNGTASSGTALTTTDLKNTGITASANCGSFGSVSWATTDWDSPFQTWISGHRMSSWVYRKSVGSDAHLVVWLEVRLFYNGAVEVLPWLENGYVRVTGPTSKNTTYSFTLGGSQRFSQVINLPHHCRTPLVSGSVLSHWLGIDPAVTPRHDVDYMQTTELVPSYRATVPPGNASALAATYTPLQIGNIVYDLDDMSSSGHQYPIGILPHYDVFYLTCNNPTAVYGGVIRNGYSAGRYPIHYRDETTNRPLRFSQYPNLVIREGTGMHFNNEGASSTGDITPAVSGTAVPQWETAHHPSLGYMAYLVTGRWYFMEQVQFLATVNFLCRTDWARVNGSAVVATEYMQLRDGAWTLRTLAQALTVTPDDDTTLRNELITSVQNTIDHHHNLYIAGVKPSSSWGLISSYSNVLGAVMEPQNEFGLREVSTWMEDFFTACYGYALSLNLPISATAATKLNDFFQWKAKWIVGRLGLSTEWWYINAVPYLSRVGAVDNGPFFTTFKQCYDATQATVNAQQGNTEGQLWADILPGADSYWGNAVTAISYAVRHGVSGASTAYNRVISASNWGALETQFNDFPHWSVKPSQPAWLSGKPLNEWFTIAGTVHAGSAGDPTGNPIDPFSNSNQRLAFSGMGLREAEIVLAACGGHQDYPGNEVTSINLALDTPAWVLRKPKSAVYQEEVAYYSDGTPSSRHTYWKTHWSSVRNRMFMFTNYAAYGPSGGFYAPVVDGFNLSTNQWDPAGTWSDALGGVSCMDSTGNAWSLGNFELYKWTASTDTWSTTFSTGSGQQANPMCYDSKRDHLFSLGKGDGIATPASGNVINAYRFTSNGTVRTAITLNASSARTQFAADPMGYAGMEYDPDNDVYLWYEGALGTPGRIYVITPNAGTAWDISILTLGGGSVTPPVNVGSVTCTRFRYVPSLRGIVLMASGNTNIYFLRRA